jgi:hypothetical protein
VDEIAVRKGHNYLTIVLDLESGRVVWIREERSEETLAGFFAALMPEQRAAIEAVATDMAAGYGRAVQEACAHAKLVYDLFHVVAKYSRVVVDVVRSQEAKQYVGPDRHFIKGSRSEGVNKCLPAAQSRRPLAGRAPPVESSARGERSTEHGLRAQGTAEGDLELPSQRLGAPRTHALVQFGYGEWDRAAGPFRPRPAAPCSRHSVTGR